MRMRQCGKQNQKHTGGQNQEPDNPKNTFKRTMVAIAHKMIRLIYLMLTRKETYHDPRVDCEAMSIQKNGPR